MLIPSFKTMLSNFSGKLLKRPGKNHLSTQEGDKAVKEAIAFLKKQKPLTTPLIRNDEIYKATRDHVLDTGSKNMVGHKGSDGSSPLDRA